MSIDQPDIIDFISIHRATGKVFLTISDHLDWSDPHAHLVKLQDKLNAYLRFCESGEIYTTYPKAKGRNIVINIAAQFPFSPEGQAFLSKARTAIESAGFALNLTEG
jgi:hypothetical protein